MNPAEPDRAFDTTAPSTRDRLLEGLLEEDGTLAVTVHGAEVSHLLGAGSGPSFYLLNADELGVGRIGAATRDLVKQAGRRGAPALFVAVGGSAPAAQALRRAAPRVQHVPMGFYHFGRDEGLAHLTGQKSGLLIAAAERATGASAAPDLLLAALERGRSLIHTEQKVAATLRGSVVVTAALTVVCVALFGVSYLGGAAMRDAALDQLGANSASAVREGELYRIFASAFLHADVAHLGVNMIALWSFGTMLEGLLGPRRYLLLYAACGLGGSLARALLGGDVRSVGASGAIWGLMAAGAAVALRPRGLLPAHVVARMRSRAWIPLVINVAYSFRPGIDMLAHFGGGLVGFGLVATVLLRGLRPADERTDGRDAERDRRPLIAAAAVVAGAAMAISVVVGIVNARPWELGRPPEFVPTAIGDTGLTMDLPRQAAHLAAVEAQEGVRIFTFGKMPSSPVVFEIIVADLTYAPSAEELEPFLEDEKRSADGVAPPRLVRRAPAARVNVGGRPAVLVEYDGKDLTVTNYIVVVGAREVLVRGYSRRERAAAWVGIEENVTATVREL